MVATIPLLFEAVTFAGILYGIVGATLFGVSAAARARCIAMAGLGSVLLLAGSIVPTTIDVAIAGAVFAALSAGVGALAVREAKPLVVTPWRTPTTPTPPAQPQPNPQMAAEAEGDWAAWSDFATRAPKAPREREPAQRR